MKGMMYPGMMQAPGMMHPGMMQAPGYGYQPLPPGGLVNLDVNSAPGFATLDIDYPPQVGFYGAGMEYSQMRPEAPLSHEAHAYTVRKGDTVYKLAKHYGTTMNAIIQANNLQNPDLIYPGQVLYIP